MKILTLKESQRESLKVLIEIRDICNEHGWRYFLTFGTLIGAVRNHGFIPWDDDIDLMMPRGDFTEFLSFMENEYKGDLTIHTRSNTQFYPWGIPRVSNDSFQFVSSHPHQKPYKLGVFVDIYPLDSWCSTTEMSLKFANACERLSKNYMSYLNPFDTKKKWRIPGKLLRKLNLSVVSIGKKNKGKFVDEQIVKLVQKYASTDDCWVGCPTWCVSKKPYKKEWFEKSDELEFEKELFSVPSGYDEFLRFCYGDYMKLPPEEERVPTHDYNIVASDDYAGIEG